jgi:hypothetical protein
VNGEPVKGLCVQWMGSRPVHLVTRQAGSPELENTLRYFEGLSESPFRPTRMGIHQIRSVEITPAEVVVRTDGGDLSLPRNLVAYSVTER